MSTTKLLIHIVFSTKERKPSLPYQHREDLYKYIGGIIRNLKCQLLAINGINDHIHLFVDIRPSISVSELVKTVKQASSIRLRDNSEFPSFEGWQEGYFAGSVGPDGKERCIQYIINQEKHHYLKAFDAEMEWLKLKYEVEEQLKEIIISRSNDSTGIEV